MQKITKKHIRQIADDAIRLSLEKLHITAPSKKTKKRLTRVSKDLSQVMKEELKRKKKHAKSVKIKTRQKISKPTAARNKKIKKSK